MTERRHRFGSLAFAQSPARCVVTPRSSRPCFQVILAPKAAPKERLAQPA
jgi:hypothetical protein